MDLNQLSNWTGLDFLYPEHSSCSIYFPSKHHLTSFFSTFFICKTMKNEEPSFLIPKSFDDILLNFALVVTENRSSAAPSALKGFPLVAGRASAVYPPFTQKPSTATPTSMGLVRDSTHFQCLAFGRLSAFRVLISGIKNQA